MRSLKQYFTTYELRRKIFHMSLGILFIFLINQNIDKMILAFWFVCAIIFALFLSIACKYLKPKHIIFLLELFDKPKDMERFPGKGAIYYLMGVVISLILFDKQVASASIAILAIGDPTSHFVGRYYGKTKLIINEKKLLEGTLAGTFFGTLAASLFVSLPLAFFGAAFGMIAEAVELEYLNLDDNFFIPFVSGLTIELIRLAH